MLYANILILSNSNNYVEKKKYGVIDKRVIIGPQRENNKTNIQQNIERIRSQDCVRFFLQIQ